MNEREELKAVIRRQEMRAQGYDEGDAVDPVDGADPVNVVWLDEMTDAVLAAGFRKGLDVGELERFDLYDNDEDRRAFMKLSKTGDFVNIADLRRLVAPVQPSAVVSREDVGEASISATAFLVLQQVSRLSELIGDDDETTNTLVKAFKDNIRYIFDKSKQLPQPVAPVHGTILEPVRPATATASTDQAPVQSGGVDSTLSKLGAK